MAIMAKMYGSLDSFVLLTIPMFMAAGILMNVGGITDRIFNFYRAQLGHLPGGLAYVNVLASFLFSGMSGSALPDVGGLGNIEIKVLLSLHLLYRLSLFFIIPSDCGHWCSFQELISVSLKARNVFLMNVVITRLALASRK